MIKIVKYDVMHPSTHKLWCCLRHRKEAIKNRMEQAGRNIDMQAYKQLLDSAVWHTDRQTHTQGQRDTWTNTHILRQYDGQTDTPSRCQLQQPLSIPNNIDQIILVREEGTNHEELFQRTKIKKMTSEIENFNAVFDKIYPHKIKLLICRSPALFLY